MRRFLIAALLAGAAATPALAQDQSDQGRWHRNQQQSNPRERQEQAPRGDSRAERFNGGGFNRPQAPQFVHQPPVVMQQAPHGGFDRPQFERRGNIPPQGEVRQQTFGYQGYRGGFDGRREQVQQVEQVHSGAWNGQRGSWNGPRGNWNGANGYYGQRPVVQPQTHEGSRWASGGWDRDWRNDRRYDWRRYRDYHRSIFHVGIYYDPFGYGYQPFDIGFRLMPAYYGPRYWINDPWDYALPPPPPGTMWIRYWNDALLVDSYSGEVVDVIHDFFW